GAAHAGGAAPQPVPPFAWDVRSTGLTGPWSSVLAASPGALGAGALVWGYSELFKSTDEALHWESANEPPGVGVVRALAFSPDFEHDGTIFIGSRPARGPRGDQRT